MPTQKGAPKKQEPRSIEQTRKGFAETIVSSDTPRRRYGTTMRDTNPTGRRRYGTTLE